MKDLAGKERVGVQFNVEAAQQHYMTATEPYKLPFSFLFFTIHFGQMTKSATVLLLTGLIFT